LETESPKNLVPKFFGKTATTYDRIAFWCTFGKDLSWKEEILKLIPRGDSFLDLGCGTGILTRKIANKFPQSKVFGVDLSSRYLDLAKNNSASFENITFVHQDAEKLKLDEKFDCITSSYIPKYCSAEVLVKNCVSHLKPNGKIILHDFTYPTNMVVRSFWNAHFVMLHLIGIFLPSWKIAFVELPKIIRTSTWVRTYTQVMKNMNFLVDCSHLTWNSSAILIGTKKS